MALDFSGGTGYKAVVGPDASIDDWTVLTMVLWVRTGTFSNGKRAMCKPGFDGLGVYKHLSMNSSGHASGAVVEIKRATTDGKRITSTSVFPSNTWSYVAMTYSEANGPRIYRGSLTSLVAQASYSSGQVGTGATGADNAGKLIIGNEDSGNQNFPGRIARAAYINKELSLAELKRLQFAPLSTWNMTETKALYELGYSGSGNQPDYSGTGNTLTVTSATVGTHVPLGSPFGFKEEVPYAVAVVAAGLPAGSLSLMGVGI